jgi:hypothetical protein
MKYVFDIDDLCDDFDPIDELIELKERFPKLKVTAFAIPSRCDEDLVKDYRAIPWIELAVHGYHHSSMECATWSKEEAASKLEELENLGWAKVFKAPGWQMSPGLYEALAERRWTLAEHAAYSAPVCETLELRRYCYNLPRVGVESIHGHTWDTSRNGPKDWEDMFFHVPVDVEFAFVSEVALEWAWPYVFDADVQDKDSSWSSQSDWGNMSMGRVYKMYTDHVKGWTKSDSFVDFGGNDGAVAQYVRQHLFDWVAAVEPEPQRARASDMKGIPTICMTLEGLDTLVCESTWDWGYCSHTLEHCEDLDAALTAIRALVRKGIVITVPLESKESFDGNPAHKQWMTRDEWVEKLGIEVLEEHDKEITGVWYK